ncbi:MAG TPA: hypothetical protein VMS21_01530, partial [Methylomirabilota bacterium]|nr:hypothetical protein [Methylomirabilota bacterium]
MKANSKKRTRKTKNALRLLPRSMARNSAFAFVACLGIWLPRAQAAVLVNLDATQLTEGPLATWPNSGTVAGDFTATGTLPNVPQVVTLDDVVGVQFVDDDTDSYVGPGSPIEVTGAGPRSIEAWVFNPDPDGQGHETVVAWGRRGAEFGNN